MLNGSAATISEYQYRTATTTGGLATAGWRDTNSADTSVTVTGLAAGDHHFQVRAVTGVTDEGGAPAGVPSGSASATVPPHNLAVTRSATVTGAAGNLAVRAIVAQAAAGQATGVTVAARVEALGVSWNRVTNADGYKVEWKSGSQGYDDAGDRQATAAGTRHTIPNLRAGVEYTVRVIATRTGAADGPPSDEATGTPVAARIISTNPARLTEENLDGATLTVDLLGVEWAAAPPAAVVTVVGLEGATVSAVARDRTDPKRALVTLAYAPAAGGVLARDARLGVEIAPPAHGGAPAIETLNMVTVHATRGPAALARGATPWLARFARTAADHVTEAIAVRLAGQGQRRELTIAGRRVPLPVPGSGTEAGAAPESPRPLLPERGLAGAFDPFGRPAGLEWRGLSGTEALVGSSFHVSQAVDDRTAAAGGWTAWGRAQGTRFDEKETDLSLDGDATTVTLGGDWRRRHLTAGVAVAHSFGRGSFSSRATEAAPAAPGEIDTALTSAHPYVHLALTDRLSVWGLLGYGGGKMTLEHRSGPAAEAGKERTDLEMLMAGAGADGALVEPGAAGGLGLSLRAEAFAARLEAEGGSETLSSMEADAWRARVALEGSYEADALLGRSLRPTFEAGLRHDGGDGVTRLGVELGGGLSWTGPAGLAAEARGRALLAGGDGVVEWGGGGSVRYTPGLNGHGLFISLAPSWGTVPSGIDRLWGQDPAAAVGDDSPAARLAAEAGYGFAVLGETGLLTPRAGVALGGEDERRYYLGAGLALGDVAAVSLTGEYTEARTAGPEHAVALRIRLSW